MNPLFKLGLSGAQGSGKTTLAKHFSDKTGIPYFDANVRGILVRNGFDCRADMNLSEYMQMQETVCSELLNSYPEESFITDRTPIDVVAYTLAYIPPTISTETEVGADVELSVIDIVTAARLSLERNFSNAILLKGSFVSSDDSTRTDRASTHLAYRMKLESLMEGEFRRFVEFTYNKPIEFAVMPTEITDLKKRVEPLIRLYEKHIDRFGYVSNTSH
ncbi:AAA family ATPase [Providencia rettgeri]